jgi:hypothetical protein
MAACIVSFRVSWNLFEFVRTNRIGKSRFFLRNGNSENIAAPYFQFGTIRVSVCFGFLSVMALIGECRPTMTQHNYCCISPVLIKTVLSNSLLAPAVPYWKSAESIVSGNSQIF